MKIRLATTKDTLPPHLDPARDTVFVAVDPSGAVVGHIALRPMLLAHSFEIDPDAAYTRRTIADALYHHGFGFAQHSLSFARNGEYAPFGILLQVAEGNDSMRKFVEGKDAREEPDAHIYRIDLEG